MSLCIRNYRVRNLRCKTIIFECPVAGLGEIDGLDRFTVGNHMSVIENSRRLFRM